LFAPSVIRRSGAADGCCRADRGDLGVDLCDRVERLQDRCTDRGTGSGRQIVDGPLERRAVCRRRDGELREAVEHDEADLRSAGLVSDILQRRSLRDGEPVRAEVGGAHRP
jgi:hypothetical protein